jgi:hypothetical protein
MKDENEQLKMQSQTMQDKCAAALSGALATARSVDMFCFRVCTLMRARARWREMANGLGFRV